MGRALAARGALPKVPHLALGLGLHHPAPPATDFPAAWTAAIITGFSGSGPAPGGLL